MAGAMASSFVESDMNPAVSKQRMKKWQMLWSKHVLLLQAQSRARYVGETRPPGSLAIALPCPCI